MPRMGFLSGQGHLMISKTSDIAFPVAHPLFNTGKYTILQPELSDIQEEGKGNNPKFIWGQVHLWLSDSF